MAEGEFVMKDMRKVVAVLALAACWVSISARAAGFMVGNEDRVVIYGDSITVGVEVQSYPRYVETYIRTRFPDWKGEAWNLGLIGDNAGNMQRYRAEALAHKPTVITFNMGMNDVVDQNGKFFTRALGAFLTNLTAIVTETRKNLPNARLVLCSPEPYEVRMVRGAPEKPMILRYASRQERRLAERLGVDFIDINAALYRNHGIAEIFAPGALNFTNDGVHNGTQGGHFLLAVAFLEGLGAEPHLAAVQLDAASGAVVSSRDVEIGEVKRVGDGLSFRRRLAHLPFPASAWQPDMRQAWADRMAYRRFEIADRLNRDLLTVTALKAGAYDVKIDGSVYGTFAAEDFAEGVNLGEFSDSPDFAAACELLHAVGHKQVAQRELISLQNARKPDAAKIAAAEKKLAEASAAIPTVSHATWHQVEIMPHEGLFFRWQDGQENVEIYFGKERNCSEWSSTVPLQAGADGRFTDEQDLSFRNHAAHPRTIEAVMPAGFRPEAFVATIPAGSSAVCRVSYDLAPDVGPLSIRVKNYPVDGSNLPLVHQVNFSYSRRTQWQAAAGDALEATIPLRLSDPGDVQRTLGDADCSGTARFVWKDGRMSIDVDVLDQNHVNMFLDENITWDDSVSISFGKGNSYGLALTANGPAIEGEVPDGVKYSARREGYHTHYSLSFPCERPKGVQRLSVRLLDRDVDQQSKVACWYGEIAEAAAVRD